VGSTLGNNDLGLRSCNVKLAGACPLLGQNSAGGHPYPSQAGLAEGTSGALYKIFPKIS
jgi:hypothetical protein